MDDFHSRKKEEFDALADTVIGMPVGEMEKTIQDYLETQVSDEVKGEIQMDDMMKHISEAWKGMDVADMTALNQKSVCSFPKSVTDALYLSMKWCLTVQPSSIPNAGNGVFLKGHIRPGTFLVSLKLNTHVDGDSRNSVSAPAHCGRYFTVNGVMYRNSTLSR